MRPIRTLGLVYDLRDDYLAEGFTKDQVAEFDTEDTVARLAAAIGELGYDVHRVGNGRALARRLVAGERWDIVFSIAEGVRGRSREAQVPALLELFDVPYVFSDPLTCAVTLDKAAAKRLLRAEGLATPRSVTVAAEADIDAVRLPFPLFAKPNAEGTGKGVDGQSRIDDADQLRRTCTRLLQQYDQPVLVEEYLPGREFTTGILGTGEDARVLGTIEVSVRPGAPAGDYSFVVKELCEKFVDYRPVKGGQLKQDVEDLALASYRALECRDGGRVDIRLDRDGRPSFMEVNPLPGLHPTHSDLPMIATQEGMSYGDLLAAIIASAATRYGLAPATGGR
jgi:D-alanine-D-alanine ligase